MDESGRVMRGRSQPVRYHRRSNDGGFVLGTRGMRVTLLVRHRMVMQRSRVRRSGTSAPVFPPFLLSNPVLRQEATRERRPAGRTLAPIAPWVSGH